MKALNLGSIASSILTVLLFISCGDASSQDSKKIKEKKDDDGQSLLWKVSGNGLEKSSYLFGTMHMISKEYFVMGEQTKKLFKASDALVMEVENIMSGAMKAQELMKLDSGKHVSEFFSEAQYDSLQKYAQKEYDMDSMAFEKKFGNKKPFAVLQLMAQKQFKDDVKSYELEFIQMAMKNDKDMLGFETIEQQLGFFDAIPKKGMADMIMQTVRAKNEADQMSSDMTKIYHDQKTDSLLNFMLHESPELMLYQDILLNDRNKAWIPKLEKFMKKQKVFTAVGAAHLFGEKGVINLLRKKGYKVTALATE